MRNAKTKMLALAGGLALAIMLAVGGAAGALAATPGATGDTFLARLAANLGIGQDKLTDAVKQTNLQLIDEAVANGTMTAEQAQAARDRVNNGEVTGLFGGGPRGGGHGDIGGGRLDEATATYFGITTDQLRQDLASAGSLQSVAAKYGKDNDAGKAGLKAALETALRQQLTDKGMAAADIDARVAQFSQNFDQYYTRIGDERGPHNPQSPTPSASPSTN